jgi:hypothetical protein
MKPKTPHPAYEDGWNDAMRLRDKQAPAPQPSEFKAPTCGSFDPFAWVMAVAIIGFQLLLALTIYNHKS